MSGIVFNLHHPKMNDDEFWSQLRELDELQEEIPDFGGFAITAKTPTGKEISVPFIRFRKTIPQKKS